MHVSGIKNRYKTCAVPNCFGVSDVSYHRFPKNTARSELWLKNISVGVKDERKVSINTRTARICALHFLEEDFNGKRLDETAVPTIFNLNCPRNPNWIINYVDILTKYWVYQNLWQWVKFLPKKSSLDCPVRRMLMSTCSRFPCRRWRSDCRGF